MGRLFGRRGTSCATLILPMEFPQVDEAHRAAVRMVEAVRSMGTGEEKGEFAADEELERAEEQAQQLSGALVEYARVLTADLSEVRAARLV